MWVMTSGGYLKFYAGLTYYFRVTIARGPITYGNSTENDDRCERNDNVLIRLFDHSMTHEWSQEQVTMTTQIPIYYYTVPDLDEERP